MISSKKPKHSSSIDVGSAIENSKVTENSDPNKLMVVKTTKNSVNLSQNLRNSLSESKIMRRPTVSMGFNLKNIRENIQDLGDSEFIREFNMKVDEKFRDTGAREPFDISKLFMPDKPFIRPHYTKGKLTKVKFRYD